MRQLRWGKFPKSWRNPWRNLYATSDDKRWSLMIDHLPVYTQNCFIKLQEIAIISTFCTYWHFSSNRTSYLIIIAKFFQKTLVIHRKFRCSNFFDATFDATNKLHLLSLLEWIWRNLSLDATQNRPACVCGFWASF